MTSRARRKKNATDGASHEVEPPKVVRTRSTSKEQARKFLDAIEKASESAAKRAYLSLHLACAIESGSKSSVTVLSNLLADERFLELPDPSGQPRGPIATSRIKALPDAEADREMGRNQLFRHLALHIQDETIGALVELLSNETAVTALSPTLLKVIAREQSRRRAGAYARLMDELFTLFPPGKAMSAKKLMKHAVDLGIWREHEDGYMHAGTGYPMKSSTISSAISRANKKRKLRSASRK